MIDGVTLRPITGDDLEFLRRLYASTRQDELAAVPLTDTQREQLIRLQFDAQQAHYRQQFPHARFDLVVRRGGAIGRLYVDRHEDAHYVIDITLMPEHRGQGVGAHLMRGVMAAAAAAGRPVRLDVRRDNLAAARFYQRLGFATTVVGAVYVAMEWAGPSAPLS